MEDKELRAKEILGEAIERTIAFSEKTKAPIDDILYGSDLKEGKEIAVYVLFDDVSKLKIMEEEKLKDQFMNVFIKYLTSNEFPFGDTPHLKFEFSVEA